ncbi:MAG: transcriptional repressor [Candidatus Electryonea clarkiae]|nr:transcriptional repressor [Candidatus Electryonea clarkiae]MDP8287699.1 transcriptional repressor [Candidatus Electryonea clarkiae]
MRISKKEVEQRMKLFDKVCREAGIKLTTQRMEIFREVAKSGRHPDAESVFRGVRRLIPMISLDTVYRNLWMLNDLGLIKTMETARESTRFDANLGQHHHFVCVNCGKMIDFQSEDFDMLKPPESLNGYGHVETTHVEVRGLCHRCENEQKQNSVTLKEGD